MTQSEKGATYKSEYAQDRSRIKKINQSMKARSPRKSPTKKLVKADSQANESPRRSTQQGSPRKPPVPSAKGIAAYRKPSPTKKSPTKRPQTAVSPTKASSPDKVESPTKRTTRAMRQQKAAEIAAGIAQKNVGQNESTGANLQNNQFRNAEYEAKIAALQE